MMNLPKDLREFIELLNSHEVRYVLVGGYAVAYHGYPRYTGDIDFFVDWEGDNPARLEKIVNEFGFGILGLSAQDFSKPYQVVQLGRPPNRVDIITSISDVTFTDAWETKETIMIDGLHVWVISRDLLLKNKRASNRPKDIADLHSLEN